MKKNLCSISIIAAAFVALTISGCDNNTVTTDKAPDSTADSTIVTNIDNDTDETIVAIVNGVKIPESRISLYSQRPVVGEEDRKLVIENMVSSELIAQAAEKNDTANRPDVREQLAIAKQAVLGRAYVTELLDNLPISEEDEQQRYEEIAKEYTNTKEYNASHILVADEAKAEALLAKIQDAPDSFSELAEEHSDDQGSAENGGELGWVIAAALVPEFSAALIKLNKGEITAAPVKTDWGWHIIRLNDTRPLPIPELDDQLRERLVQNIRAEQITEHVKSLREKASVEIL